MAFGKFSCFVTASLVNIVRNKVCASLQFVKVLSPTTQDSTKDRQSDFHLGTGGGTVSQIIPMLAPGTIATVCCTLAKIVVTEYGIARLEGKTQQERAQELMKIAHPDFRSQLEKEAGESYWP